MAHWWRPKYALILIPLLFLALWLALFAPYLLSSRTQAPELSGSPFPKVDLMDGSGEARSASQFLKPGRRHVVALWATWCEPCLRELPLIQEKQNEYSANGIEFLLINYDGGLPDKTIPEVRAWLTSQRLRLETLFDFKEKLFVELQIVGLPFAMGVNENRKILWTHMGEIDWREPSWLEKTRVR